MVTDSKSTPRLDVEALFADHPVLTLGTWAATLGGPRAAARARQGVKYYSKTGKLRRLTHGVYAVVPPGVEARRFSPDPYLVAAVLRPDAILSHHTALELLGQGHSVFNRFTYVTRHPRRPLRVDSLEWRAVRHPAELLRKHRTDFGVRAIDRRGMLLRVTAPERTIVDCFAAPDWAGGLDELVESACGFRDLDLDLLGGYLKLLDRRILNAALGWFIERHPEVADSTEPFLDKLMRKLPRQPLYLGSRTRSAGGRLQSRWKLIVPEHLSLNTGFEGAPL
jgi:predicted transcriptional regulator of viral defense system